MKNVFYVFIALCLFGFVSDKPAYRIFKYGGKLANYSKMQKATENADIVFFGEIHSDPICHWLQYELTKDLYNERKDKIVLGAEMFETDGQLILDEYLGGEISQAKFESEMRLWKNYMTDYKRLVEFAKDNGIEFVATNIPRRYASKVFKEGLESLENLKPEAKKYIAPLPIDYNDSLPCYQKMKKMFGMVTNHQSNNLPKAQAIKDATMAHFILKHWERGKTFVHFNGTYHSNNFESIVWFLKQAKPDLKIVTIATVQQENIEKLEEINTNLANFILCVPSSMTQTHH